MPSRHVNGAVLAVLATAAVVLAALNVWVTFARSAIPFSFNTTVVQLEWNRLRDERLRGVRRPFGFDSACLVTLADGRVLEVDPTIYNPLRIGDRIEKRSWNAILYRNGRPMRLRLSEEAVGMVFLMPAVVASALALTLHHLRRAPG